MIQKDKAATTEQILELIGFTNRLFTAPLNPVPIQNICAMNIVHEFLPAHLKNLVIL